MISEDLRNALNAFLYRTGEASSSIMVVYASNQPESFDWAVNDRLDEVVLFDLPTVGERVRMLRLYVEQYIKAASTLGAKPISVVDIDDDLLTRVAEQTEGFSGREISKLVIAWQAAAYGRAEPSLDPALALEVLAESKAAKQLKLAWR